MNKKNIKIREEDQYITLQNLLKIEDYIDTGGMAKTYLIDNDVYVNGVLENRRGRKLYRKDKIKISDTIYTIE
ncbi:MAG: RNA-binding S4 domain-containing protein [Bacilli bacterium]